MFTKRHLGTVALAAALIIPTAACAQQQTAQTAPAGTPAVAGTQGHHGHGHRGWGAALKGITLSDAQKQQLKDLRAQQKQQQTAGQTLDPATRKANRQAMMQKVEAILTPAQRAQFEQNLQQMRSRHRENAAPATAPTPGA